MNDEARMPKVFAPGTENGNVGWQRLAKVGNTRQRFANSVKITVNILAKETKKLSCRSFLFFTTQGLTGFQKLSGAFQSLPKKSLGKVESLEEAGRAGCDKQRGRRGVTADWSATEEPNRASEMLALMELEHP